MIAQTNFENKSMGSAPEPDVEVLRERVNVLRADENFEERELHAAQAALEASEGAVRDANFSMAKGNTNREILTHALLSQASAQAAVVAVIEKLNATRMRRRHANDALVEGETRLATRRAADLEREIVDELLIFAEQAMAFAKQCAKMENLRSRAQEMGGQRLLSPGVTAALFPNWAEIRPGIDSRLELIAKCAPLPDEAASIVLANARKRAREAAADLEAYQKNEAARKRGARRDARAGEPFSTEYVDGQFVYSRAELDV